MRISLLIVILFSWLCGYAQRDKRDSTTNRGDTIIGRQNLLYQINASKTLFLPVIEDLLKNLKFRGTSILIFDKINSINELTEGASIRKVITQAKDYYSLGKMTYKVNSTRVADNVVLNILKEDSLFLDINIIEINPSLYEYQLDLYTYETTNLTNDSFDIYPKIGGVHRTASIVVDPLSGNYKLALSRGLKKIFKESIDPPHPDISPLNFPIKQNSITILERDTLKLKGNALDDDSPDDALTYSWSVDGPADNRVFLTNTGNQAEILFDSARDYQLSLKISDGITSSVQTCTVHVRTRPKIYVLDPATVTDHNFCCRLNYLEFVRYFYDRADIYCYDNVLIGNGEDDSVQFLLTAEDEGKLDNAIVQLTQVPIWHGSQQEDKSPPILLDNVRSSTKFNISPTPTTAYAHGFVVHVPQGIDVPAKYLLTITPTTSGLAGEPLQLSLNFYRIRRLFFQIGIQGEVPVYPTGPNLAVKGGIGYTIFPFGAEKVNICFNQGLYLFRPELKTYSAMIDFQELYIEKPLRKAPFSFRLGARMVYFDYYAYTGTQFKAEPYLYAGIDWVFSSQLSRSRVSITWAGQYNYNSLTTNIFTFGYCIDILSAKKR